MNIPAKQPRPDTQSPDLPPLHNLSISPVPYGGPTSGTPGQDYRYSGVFGPPGPQGVATGWGSPGAGKRGSRSGLPQVRRDSLHVAHHKSRLTSRIGTRREIRPLHIPLTLFDETTTLLQHSHHPLRPTRVPQMALRILSPTLNTAHTNPIRTRPWSMDPFSRLPSPPPLLPLRKYHTTLRTPRSHRNPSPSAATDTATASACLPSTTT